MGANIQPMVTKVPDVDAELKKQARRMSIEFENNPLLRMLPNNITIENFPCPDIQEIYPDYTVSKALSFLLEKGILSAPVWDEEQNKYLGFLHISDLLTLDWGFYLLDASIDGPGLSQKAPQGEADMNLAKSTTVGDLFKDENSEFVIRAQARFQPVATDATLVDVMRKLNRGTLRRVPVLNTKTGRVSKIISQSTIVAELHKELSAATGPLPEAYSLTAQITGIGLQDVISVGEETAVMEAFHKMIDNKISAVGVVDGDGKLEAMISLKDLRLLPVLKGDKLVREVPLAEHNAVEYASMVRKLESNGKGHVAVATVTETTPFVKVIGKLSETKMHRVFIVNKERKPIGVISISDIFHLLCYNVLPDHLAATSSVGEKTDQEQTKNIEPIEN